MSLERERSSVVTAIPTSIDRAVDTPVPAGGLRAVGIAGGLVAVALAGASLGADELVVGELGASGAWWRCGASRRSSSRCAPPPRSPR